VRGTTTIVTPYKATGIYNIGEKVGWTASLPQGVTPTGDYTYTVKKNNLDVIKTGKARFWSGRPSTVHQSRLPLNEPAMIYVRFRLQTLRIRYRRLGAAVAPEKLQPSVSRPPTSTVSGPPK